jgi:hypothetical protein
MPSTRALRAFAVVHGRGDQPFYGPYRAITSEDADYRLCRRDGKLKKPMFKAFRNLRGGHNKMAQQHWGAYKDTGSRIWADKI